MVQKKNIHERKRAAAATTAANVRLPVWVRVGRHMFDGVEIEQ